MLEQHRETRETGLEVAVIGMAGRFPGAENIHEFWQNLKNGVESITFFSDEELKEMGVEASFLENSNYIKAGGYFAGIEYFDAAFFGYTPSEAAVMDPQIRFLHECAWEALEDAGCDPDSYEGLVGVYVGAADNVHWRSFVLWGARMDTEFVGSQFTDSLLSNKDLLCSRLSYQLNLTGPSYTVNSACSTSMVAIHRGCRGLLGGECDMALAGGVSVTTSQQEGYLYQEGMIESADGHCRAFDARANGTVLGSGIGVVILKRLDEAVEQGNHIYAVIKGTAVNNDGKRKVGFTAPSVEGQSEVIRAAYQVAEVDPDTIGYIEAHGTGTALGDPIEIKALVRGMNRTPGSRCPIGAVKTNVGHLDTAAGAAGFIKTVLCLKHRMIPPTLHFKTPNPELELEKTPFYVTTELMAWERQGDRPLRAAVSSFGIGGTNVHAILEEWQEVRRSDGQKDERPQLILLSAKTAEALDKMTGNLANYLEKSLINPVNPGFLGDVAYTLQMGRKAFVHRKALVCSTVEEAVEALSNPGSPLVQTLAANEEFRHTVFMFSGQGSQYVNMGLELYREEAVFRKEMDRCFDILKPLTGYDIKEILYPGEVQNRSYRSNKCNIPGINQTEVTQPVIFAFEYALARLLMSWGITPDAMIGYSFGEYTAACLAGVFSLEDVLALAALRGRLMQKLSTGAMLSVPLPEEELRPLLDDGLSIAIINEPACIVAGDAGAIERFEEKMRQRRLVCMRLHANFAVHTSLMDDAVEVFAARLRQMRLHEPRVPYISGITGDWIAAVEAVDYRYWLRHLRETIRFSRGIQCLLKEKRSIFIEIGPGRDLTVLVKRYIDNNAPQPVINLLRPSRKDVSDVSYLLRQVGRLWLYRQRINWKGIHFGDGTRNKRYLVPLPTYPFDHKRYWPNQEYNRALSDDSGAAGSGSRTIIGTRAEIDHWFYLPSWKRCNIRDTGNLPANSNMVCLIFSPGSGNGGVLAVSLEERLKQGGVDSIVVCQGTAFSRRNRHLYSIDPRESRHYDLLVEELCKENRVPRGIFHLWNITGETGLTELDGEKIEEVQYSGFYSLIYLAGAIGSRGIAEPIRILVVSNHMQEVMGEEVRCPGKVTLLGPVKLISQEYPNIRCRSVDIDIDGDIPPDQDQGPRKEQLIRRLITEMLTDTIDPVIAYRSNQRWVQVFEPVSLEKPDTGTPYLKDNGVYWLTGGLGGIGLVLAEHFARQARVKLVITCRSGLPDQQQGNKLRELEEMGAEVLVMAADVSDRQQMAGVIRRVKERFGTVNGVIHAAGVADYGGVIQGRRENKRAKMSEAVLAPKLKGTIILESLIKEQGMTPNFMVLCSSIASIAAPFGEVAYNAANAFLDAYAHYYNNYRVPHRPMVYSIDWSGWQQVGMAVEAVKRRGQNPKTILKDQILPSEGVEAFDRILNSEFPQVVVSPLDLDLLLRQPLILQGGLSAEPPGEDGDTDIATGNIHRRPELDTPYAAPENEIQRKLVQIWQRFFGLEAVGIDDDFFDLGGDSLKAGVIISRIHKKLDVAVSLAEIFDNPTVRQLSRCLGGAAEEEFISINPGEKKEYYALTPAQQRFYMMQQMHPGTTAYNISQVISLGPGADKKRIETTCKRLMESHESLRTAFIIVDDKPVQKVYDEVEFEIEFFDLAAKNAKGREEEENIMRYFVRPFELSRPPLLRVGLVETAGRDYLLLVDMHHIISDGTSQMVLSGNFMSLYNGESLEPIRLQYRDFSQWQNRMLETESGRIKADRVFWLDTLAGKLPVLNIPTDFPRPRERSYAGGSFSGSLGRELSREVSRLGRQTNTTLYMVLLTALNILLFRYTGQKDIIIGSPSAGRNHTDLEKIIGLVIGTIMMRNFPSAEKPFREFLQEVKARTLAAYEHHAYPFEELLKKLDYREDPSRNPVSDVALIVQNMFPAVPGESARGVPGAAKLDFTIYALEQGEEIIFIVEYSTALFRRGTMERLAAHLGNILREAIKNPEISLGEIDLLTTGEKRGVIGTDVVCFPLSHPQKRIYYTEKRYPHTGVCNLAFTARYNRLLDRGLLEEAINRALQGNEGLRLRIVEFDYFNDPFQYIAPSRRFTLEEVRFGLSGGLAEWLEQEARKPFDPVNNDFFYFAYLKFSENESGYYMKFHHIAADGWTILSLFKEIDEIYETLETGNPVEVDTTPSYLQFISDENDYLNSSEAGKDRDFWHRYLLPLPEKIELSPGNRNNAGAAVEADVCILAFPGDLRTQIHQYCRTHRTSIFKVLLSALSVYIWRVTGKNDFVIGSANHNRTTEDHRRMAGMFVSTIPFRMRINESMTFAGLLEKTGRETGNILKNYQRYPFDLLMDELREKTGEDVGYLLDVNLVGHPDMKEDKYRIEHHFPGYEPTPLSIHINGNNRDIRGILEMEWDFQLQQFSLEDIQRIHRGLVHILTDALVNLSKELRQIDWVSPEEKEQVVDLFNRSGTVEAETFYADKPLHRLFEEQAEKSGDGVAVVSVDQIVGAQHAVPLSMDHVSITYKELNEKSDQLAVVLKEKGVLADDIVAIMVERSLGMIIGILGILKTGAAYLPIDPDYPRERIDYMLKDSNSAFLLTAAETVDVFKDKGTACCAPTISCDLNLPLAYIIYTSGSTGNPKGVMVTHGNVVNYLNAFDWQFDLQPMDIVVQQASYVFDAFVEEMYPILLKGGTLAIPLREEVTDIQRLVDFIARHQVTMITCSPLMLSQLNRHPAIYGTPIRIFISGGDRLKNEHIDNLLKIETAKVYNTYGPTETTVCAAYYRVADNHEAAIPIGKPIPGYRIYILDAYLQPVPVGVNGELCIAGIGVSQGYLNQPELTAERFFDYRSYKTGDLARWLADGNIEFIGRIDSQVNIRGYRIEPGEIENRLNKLETIHDALVVAREDKSGDFYLCAYIIPGDRHVNVSGLREYLLRQLPTYMVPAFFVTVESIPLTPNGKPDLKALPDPWSGPVDDYAPPVDRTEEELVTLWSEVLNIPGEHIGVTANFFELGGHSLKATLLVSYIHKKLNVELSLADVFKTPTIRELSGSIKALTKNAYSLIEPAAKKEYYSLSSAQKRLYFLQQMDLASIAYNMPLVLPLGKGIEKVKLETALKKLIRRHESLRTSFEVVNGEPVQRIHDEMEFEIEFLAAKAVARHPKTKDREGIVRNFIRPFDLSKAPLMRSGLIKTHDGNHTWMVDIHHIVSDGTSHTVLAEDFTALYNEKELEPLRLHYKDFSEWQNRLIESGKIKKQEDYWLKLYSGEIPRLHMPTDYKRPEVFTFVGAHYYFMLPGEDAAKFKALASRKGGTLYMNIMAALNTLFYKYTGQSDIIIGSGIAGRSHADLQRIIGMFVNTLAMRNFPRGEKTYEFLLTEVIAHSVEAFENQDVQFEELVEKLDPERDPSRNPLFDISMVVQNFRRLNEVTSIRKEPDQGNVLPLITTKFDMTFFTVESNGNVYFDVEYYTGVFKKETIRRLVSHFINIIKTVVNNPSIKLKDIDIISGEERKQVLYELNDTAEDYPGDKAIHQLLEEIVEKTPDLIAIVGKEKSKPASVNITYKELNEKSNQLANYLYDEKHIRPEEPVGIWMTQPVALAVAVLGILKASAAYVPLDPSLPEDRLKYMIDDARIGIVISEKRYIKTLNRLQWECDSFHSYMCMDSYDIHGEAEVETSELMDEELWNHVGETAADDITAGGWVSSYTGEPFSRLEMDEYADNILTKLEPLLDPGMRVLEIGCASGITMYRIAPKAGLYYGTDLSPVMIEWNRKKVEKEGYRNIKLSCLAAHEIHRIEERNFDLIIMNSVIQCFHGHHYLRKVILQCIELLGERGYLFLGDIMDREKKDALVRELTAFKYAVKKDFSAELFISRGYWEDLGAESDVIADIRFSDKLFSIENELTRFRYDVLITVNKKIPGVGKNKWKKQKYQEDATRILEYRRQGFPAQAGANNLAYIIYTSGTTGVPKGVEMEHRSVVNTLCCRKAEYGMNSQDAALQLFSYGFDGFVTGFFTPLISGARLIVLSGEEQGNVDKIKGAIVKNGVTHFISVPPLYNALLESMTGGELSTLKAVTLAGDRVSVELLERTKEKSGCIEIVNEYGVTEAAVMSTLYRNQDRDNTIKIGHPIWNTHLYVLDEGDRLQPVGVPGELCISGIGLARGYLNNPELTAGKFFVYRSYRTYRTYISKKIYKTGDLARWHADGNIEFLGRIDHQVKIRGFRIELGEIESRLLKHEWIKEAVVIDRENEQGDKYLCAYIRPEGVSNLDNAALKEYLARTLPAYMIPRYFVRLDRFPITSNGKLDRKKLPKPGFTPGEAYVAPATETEEKLAVVWSEVLGIEKEVVGVESGFFELGGHSLSLIKMKTKIKDVFDIDIPVARMFQLSTIRALALFIQGEETSYQAAEEILDESVDSMDRTVRLFEEFEDE